MKPRAPGVRHRAVPRASNATDELVIDSLGSGGEGVGRLDELVAFVPLTAPGDRVRVRVVERKKRFVRARLVEVLDPGPGRVTPPCAVFGHCGGCDWQHLDYAVQLEAKRVQLEQTLRRVGALDDPPVAPTIPSGRSYGYRDRIRGTLAGGRLHLHRRGTGEPVPIERCEIADERINARLADLADLGDSADPAGGLDGAADARVEVAVVDDRVVVLDVDDERATGLGFRQVNPDVARRLEALLLDDIAAAGASTVHDLYCGAGTWTLPVAAANPDARVIGVEVHAGSVRLARERARASGAANVEFRHGKVEKLLKGLTLAGSVCIVDPPRAGLDERTLARLVAEPPATLAYVSCHPATLARDLKALHAAFELVHVQPLDMFPQTAHLECRALLRARPSIRSR